MCFSNLFPKICTGDEVGTSLNTEAAVHKYYTEEICENFETFPGIYLWWSTKLVNL